VELLRNKTDRLKSIVAIGLACAALTGCEYRAEAKSQPTAAPVAVEIPAAAPLPNIADKLTADLTTALNGNRNIQIAVHDRTTNQTYLYPQPTNFDPHPELKTYDTASTIKLSILEELLLQNQAKNLPLTTCPEIPMPVQMTCGELENAIPMIENSDNDAASALWTLDGGAGGVQNLYSPGQLDTSSTTARTDGQWGWSQTTAADQLKVVNLLSDPASPLSPTSKATVNFLLDHVESDQHWGASGGVPAGVTVRVKNGWMPYTQQTSGPWTINSIGNVNGNGVNYDIAEYSDSNDSMQSGISVLETAAKVVFDDLSSTHQSS